MEDGNVEDACKRVHLQKMVTDKAWGFSMAGGQDQGCTLYIAKVNPRSLADKSGLKRGDAVLRIQDMAAKDLTHDEARAEILRAGNDLRLVVQRGRVPKGEIPLANRRSLVLEEKTEYRGDPNPTTQSRTFMMLNQFLESEMDAMERDRAMESNSPQPEIAPIHGSLYAKKVTKIEKPVLDSPTKQAVHDQAAAASTKRVRTREAARKTAASTDVKATVKVDSPAATTVKVESPASKPKEDTSASTPKAATTAAKKVETPAAKKVETSPAKKVETSPAKTPAAKTTAGSADATKTEVKVAADNGPKEASGSPQKDATTDGPAGESEASFTVAM